MVSKLWLQCCCLVQVSIVDLLTEAKYAELSEPAEKVWFRVKEMTLRPEAISALQSKLEKVEAILKKWETDKPHITEEEKGDVMEKVGAVKKWIEEKEAEQAEKQAYEDPAFTSEEVPLSVDSISLFTLIHIHIFHWWIS